MNQPEKEYTFDLVGSETPTKQYNFDLAPAKVDVNPAEAKMKEDPEGFWDWASLEGARTFFEAASFNLGDDAANAIVATYHAMNDANPIDSWSAYYDMVKKDYRKGQEQYAEEFPVASTALNVAGSVASPLSYVKAPSTVIGMTARAAGEGALIGAGTAENMDEIPELASEGAMWGAGVAGVTGYMFKGLTRKNIQQDLDTIDEAGKKVFTPITLAADIEKGGESSIQGLYRDIVAPTYLAKSIISKQENLILDPLEKRVIASKENLSLIGKDVKANTILANAKFKEAKEAMREGYKGVIQRVGNDITDAKELIKANNEVLKDAARGGYSQYSVDAGQQIAKDAAGFREQVLNMSFPVNIGSKPRQNLVQAIKTAKTPQAQYELIDELWKDAGFEYIKKNAKGKDRVFPIKLTDLNNDIYKRILSSDKLSARVGNKAGLANIIDNNLGFLMDKVSKGRIKGTTLMTTRNELAMKANSLADNTIGDADRAVLRAAVDSIDDYIIKKLPSESAAKLFKADKAAWSSYAKFKDSVKMRSKAGEFGMFEPSDYIDVSRRHSKELAGKGKSLLQEEAEIVNARIQSNRQRIKDHAHEVMRDTTNQQIVSFSKLAKKKQQQLKAAQKEYSKEFKGATRKYEESINKAQRGIEIQKLETELSELQEHIGMLTSQRSQKHPSWFQSIAAVGLLGGFVTGGAAGAATAAGVGVGVGASLATKTGQRVVAGQSAPQTFLRNTVPESMQLKTSQLLGRVMAEDKAEEAQQQQ